ncbi:MAG TPA: glycosyltransferase family 2 protein [Candidatus Dormibacteraeota bacterium]|nr:glycosyltransferase family 2 protein [Candidatus Dormibacteraeota bacterium]
MRKTVTFSIVTPSFNQADFLERTMNSVLGQEGNFKIEYIVADGGSTDRSAQIMKDYADRVKKGTYPLKCKGAKVIWWSRKDKGQSDAINKGWRKVTGDYVAYLNSDDLYTPGALEEARLAFEENPQADMVYSNWVDIDENDKVIEKHEVIPFDLDFEINTGNLIPQPTVFIKKHVLDEVGLLNPEYHYAMDYDLWVRIGQKFNILYIDAWWAAFRLHDSSKTVSLADKFWKEERAISRKYGGKFFSRLYFSHLRRNKPYIFEPIAKFYRAGRMVKHRRYGLFASKVRANLARLVK